MPRKTKVLPLEDARRIGAEGQDVEFAVSITAEISATMLPGREELAKVCGAKGEERRPVLDDLIQVNVDWESSLDELAADSCTRSSASRP